YVLPTILAHVVGSTSVKAGFIGLGILFLAGAGLWAASRDDHGADAHVPGAAKAVGGITR
ncbi:MAG: hypothetical protein ACRDN0_03455, partial [Trebonia sp.]